MKTFQSKALLASIALVALAQQASATITFDLRATAINGVPIPVGPGQKSPVAVMGDSITLDVYAVVTGAVGNIGLEGFTSFLTGDILSGAGGAALGNIENPQLISPFNSGAVSAGTIADLDADGDLDLGSNNAGTFVQGQHITIRAAAVQLGNADGITASEFRAFTTGFRITQVTDPLGSLSLNFRITNGTGATSFEVLWREDGVAKQTTAPIASNGVLIGSPIQVALIQVPEPSAFGMVLLGAMGLVGFRRLGLRRS